MLYGLMAQFMYQLHFKFNDRKIITPLGSIASYCILGLPNSQMNYLFYEVGDWLAIV